MNQIIERNLAKAKDLRGAKGDQCYKTDKGWAQVAKCREVSTSRPGSDGKPVVERNYVVYLDTIGADRRRVKLSEAEVAKLDTATLAEASKDGKKAATPKDGGKKAATPKDD